MVGVDNNFSIFLPTKHAEEQMRRESGDNCRIILFISPSKHILWVLHHADSNEYPHVFMEN